MYVKGNIGKKEYSNTHLTVKAELQMRQFLYKNYIKIGRDVKIMRDIICTGACMLNHF
jgi:hypothetical protein